MKDLLILTQTIILILLLIKLIAQSVKQRKVVFFSLTFGIALIATVNILEYFNVASDILFPIYHTGVIIIATSSVVISVQLKYIETQLDNLL